MRTILLEIETFCVFNLYPDFLEIKNQDIDYNIKITKILYILTSYDIIIKKEVVL